MDIIEQIQELSDKFGSLFEIEGLGDPASDTPPSTNKIKKDVKTKDGKVELVSVEDELFPKDGNKREQFKQKVIDTINGMIQGTATLEDLLQIVRQKQVKTVKEGFEGAIEIIEDLFSAINKSNKSEEEKDKLYDKARKASYTEMKDSELRKARDPRFKSSNVEARYWTKRDNDEGREQKKRDEDKGFRMSKHGRPIHTRNGEIVPFAEAIELLEELINEVSDATVERAVTHASKKVSDTLFKAGGTNQDTINQYKKIKKLADLRAKRTGRKLEADVDAGKYKHVDLKEAQEILETALDAIKKSDLPDEKKRELRGKLAKANQAERDMADKRAWDSYIKGERKFSDTTTVRDPNFTKNANGNRKTRLRSARNNFDDHGWQKIKPEWKQVEDSIKRHEKKAKLEEAQELLEDLYTKIKKEHGEPKYAGIDSHPANKSAELIHKMSDAKGKEYAEEKEKNPDINLYNKRCTTKNTRGEQKTQNRSSQYRKFSDDWRLPKTDDEKVTASIRRNKLKPVKEAQQLLEEIINEVSLKAWKEAARNSYDKRKEIADKSAELDKANWDSYEKAVAKSPEDEPELYRLAQKNSEQAYKDEQRAKHADKVRYVAPDSKHSANKYLKAAHNAEKTNSEKADYRKSLYQDEYAQKAVYARHKADMDPVKSRTNESFEGAIKTLEELLQGLGESSSLSENLYKQINKKVNKGELSIDKAIKLEDKLQDKISPEKRNLDSKELESELKTSLEPQIEVNKTLKALRRDDKRRNDGKANYKFTFDHRPVKEALSEAQKILELFDRPDLLNDIDTALGSPVKKFVKNIFAGKKKQKKVKVKESFDSSLEKGYNSIEETLVFLEALINEVSDRKHREKIEELGDGIKRAEEFKEATKDDLVKNKLEDVIISQEHRLNVSKDKYDNRVIKREQEKYDKNKAEKEKGK